MDSDNPMLALKEEMDKYVVGHEEVKMALLLGIISREHIYVEGPPGTAKTMLSEIITSAAQLKFFFYQLHRDTRLSELIGDLVISKETTDSGEIIKQKVVEGGILTSEICLLDDISRAPGESLNVLLRILNERKFFNRNIPLLTAIATSNPTADEYYNEPLDPANLDRFVLQVKSRGISYGKKWEDAKKVIEIYSSLPTEPEVPVRVNREVLDSYYTRLGKVEIPEEVQQGLADFITILVEDFGLNESNSLISDRTFFVKSLKIIRAHALLNNRDVCTMDDLKALKYMTVFRIPEEVFEQLDEILESLGDKKKSQHTPLTQDENQNTEQEEEPPEQEMKEVPDDEAEKESEESNDIDDAKKTFFQALKELKDNIEKENSIAPPEDQEIPSDPTGKPADDGKSDEKPGKTRQVFGSKSKNPGEEDEFQIPGKRNYDSADNIKVIMKVLEGNFQRNIARKAQHPGGVPRKYKRMNHFDEMHDVDPFDAFIWSDNTTPSLPRVHKREKHALGGEIAILRDVSTSMMGIYSEWSSSVVRGVLELARNKNMRVGYVEFNHKSYKYKKNSRFFTRDYDWILDLSSNTECSGNTNYEDALSEALSEFRGRGFRNKHILFITDGIPTSGDCEVVNERHLAKKLGVSIHSIFIGSKNYPKILQTVSRETVGTQFIASKTKNGKIKIDRQDKLPYEPRKERLQVDPFEKIFTKY